MQPSRDGPIHTRSNLLEVSVVAVPAHPDALVTATRGLSSGRLLTPTVDAEAVRRGKARRLLEQHNPVKAQLDRWERARRLQSWKNAGYP